MSGLDQTRSATPIRLLLQMSGRRCLIERCKTRLDEGEFVFALSNYFARIASEHCENGYETFSVCPKAIERSAIAAAYTRIDDVSHYWLHAPILDRTVPGIKNRSVDCCGYLWERGTVMLRLSIRRQTNQCRLSRSPSSCSNALACSALLQGMAATRVETAILLLATA